ncbi:uncharacterized protein N7511_008365 [Penicillium nucicola]|uniref:uncharacterized protein n=1 Tax=Penicillium nucicola TaxID=1850975 RepID=UPI0025456EF3|nr:uncharacterized protein N7511_008365 [Penicillium nucicola]KAJ5751400.1 hypothetical protein N7511_008365 [Penicillium nucicola]
MFLNRFAALTLEDPEKTQPKQKESPETQKIAKVELLENDREEEKYRDKKIDPMDAAVVTDNAAKLARDLVQEVGPLLIPM